MQAQATPSRIEDAASHSPEAKVLELAGATGLMIAVARTLVRSNRRIDMDGLADHVGLLCAKALDLPPSRTALVKLELTRVATALAALDASLRANAG